MKITAIITAGGIGSRFSKSGKPKQYININGIPMILYSLLAFQESKAVNEIIVSADNGYFDFLHGLILKNNIKKLSNLVERGKTRYHSVKNAFMQVNGLPNDIIIIHDAVRPNINVNFIEKLVSGLRKYDGLIPGLEITETVKKEKKGIVAETINREHLVTVQTPQVFRYRVLKESYRKCGNEADFTDEAALVEKAGFKVKITDGNKSNIKITTPGDIQILKAIWNTSLNWKIITRR